jgi:hypothetical protein
MLKRGITLTIAASIIVAAACGSDDSPTGTAAVVAVTVSAPSTAIFVGSTSQLTATAKDASGNAVSGAAVTWTSSSDAIATVSTSGLVTGVAPGTATITATSNGKTATTTMTVSLKTVSFSATMTPAGELGVNLNGSPTGSGTFTATLDTTTNIFTWSGTFTGLTSNVNNGHIHGPFAQTATTGSAGVLLNFNPSVTPGATFTGLNSATAGSVSGSVTLNSALTLTPTVNGDSLKKLLLANATYVNIHTTLNGGGEIRAQLLKK